MEISVDWKPVFRVPGAGFSVEDWVLEVSRLQRGAPSSRDVPESQLHVTRGSPTRKCSLFSNAPLLFSLASRICFLLLEDEST